LIEAGVDISVDLIYRDLAPLDCVIQTAGRCNRNNEEDKGNVKIVKLRGENRDLCKYIYDSTLIYATKDIIAGEREFEERELNPLLRKYYECISKRGSEEESRQKIEEIEGLKFSGISEFRLIEDDYWKVDVFVEIAEEARQIWRKYEEIMKKSDRFERRREFLRIKRKFYDYVISVDAVKLGAIVIEHNMGYISLEDVGRRYDLETGFKTREKEGTMIY
jgi:CRISPR-associated endonuclease/helicase Cas3